MATKGFIFDLDGVIVDTAKYHFLAWKKLANSIGIDFNEAQNEQLKGVNRIKSLEKILDWGNKSLNELEFMQLIARKNDDFLKYINNMDASEILPDVPKIINYLNEKNQPIALGSASKNASRILYKVGLYDNFKAVLDGNSVRKGKPDPEIFLLGAEKMGIRPSDCIVFEDSIAGIEAANKANMISVGIGNKDVLHKAYYVFKDFTEISTKFIQELINR